MKNYVLAIIACVTTLSVSAQKIYTDINSPYRLKFINQDATLDSSIQIRLIHTFFKVYPELAAAYNPGTLKDVTMVVDTAYKGVAETDNGKVTIASSWLHKRPEDIDVVTHEVMHIVQDYGESTGPGWLTEGIADYARNKYGVNNEAAKWSLTPYKAGQNYDNAYRITARFLVWIEEKIKPGIVKDFNTQLRLHKFTDNSWKIATGKTVDELWAQYIADPAI